MPVTQRARRGKTVRSGCLCALAAALLIAFGWPAWAQGTPPIVWGCLLYASNNPGPVQTPVRLNRYDKKLEQETGFTSLQTVGENQAQLTAGHGGVLMFPGDLRVAVMSVSREPDSTLLVGLELFRGDKQLLV